MEGIDTQIRLHINAVHEARWRAQAFGRTSQLALETAEKHKAAVIELRGKRQELYSLYTFEKSNCPILYMPEDSSDAYDAEGEKYKASRDPSRPEGYSLVVK